MDTQCHPSDKGIRSENMVWVDVKGTDKGRVLFFSLEETFFMMEFKCCRNTFTLLETFSSYV